MINVHEVRIMITVGQYERSLRFYHETLELTELLETWESPTGRGAIIKLRDGAILELIGEGGGEIYGGPTPVAISLALRLDSPQQIDEWYERLAGAGVQILEKPTNKPWGEHSFAVADPDGNVVHLYAQIPHIA
jgi:catechol 2,3-dioxygenase-like lactoylglutathione lyase family enzyme